MAFIEWARPHGVGGGLLLQILDPKAYAVNTALFTGFAFLPDSYALEVAIKFLIMNAIWIPVHFLWLMAGVTLHRLDLSERSHSLINIVMALSMLAVVAIAVIAQLR